MSATTRPLRILYGVPSEGMGHATRSKVMIQHLVDKGHEVKVATSDRAAKFLSDFDILEIRGLHLKYEDGEVSKFDSMCMNLKPEMLKKNVSQFVEAHKEFQPDMVITDFDSFSYFYAKAHGLPILSLDNIQFCARYDLEIDIPKSHHQDYETAKRLTAMKVPGCERYLVISSWPGKPNKDDTYKVPPVLRQIVINTKPSKGKHCLVYQTSTSQDNMIPELQKVPDTTFYVYGFNRDEIAGNVQMKKFSEEGFVNDLASACAVVTNGGYSLITEAMYLHKPLCCFPIAGQFEQYLNASYVQKLGYGESHDVFSGEKVGSFLSKIDRYTEAVSTYTQNGNVETCAAVDFWIEQYTPKSLLVSHKEDGHKSHTHKVTEKLDGLKLKLKGHH